MTPRLFVYGTLLLPEVLQVVTGRRIQGRPARLSDHARFALRGRVYPAVVPQRGAVTEGIVLDGLEARELARLDRFEGDLYERRPARLLGEAADLPRLEAADLPRLGAADLPRLEAEDATTVVYVLAERHRGLLASTGWNVAAFERVHGADYVERCRAWALHDGRGA